MIVKRVGVLSAAKFFGTLFGLYALIAGSIISLMIVTGGLEPEEGVIGVIFGANAAIILPILYGIAGVLAGVITAVLYNIVARIVGGIELELVPEHGDRRPAAPDPRGNS